MKIVIIDEEDIGARDFQSLIDAVDVAASEVGASVEVIGQHTPCKSGVLSRMRITVNRLEALLPKAL